MEKNLEFNTESYIKQSQRWPSDGKHILAQYTDDYVIVYQAFNKDIADYAVRNQKFGGNSYKMDRTSWIKTNFLWMMYRSQWATRHINQEHILAIYLTVEGFEEILSNAYSTEVQQQEGLARREVPIRLQWYADKDPQGESQIRRAIQLAIKPKMMKDFHEKWIIGIRDVTEFVQQQRQFIENNEFENLVCPSEKIYVPRNQNTSERISLTV